MAPTNDDLLLDRTFAASTDAISEVVTAALHEGRALADLAVVVHRTFDGNTSVEIGSRREIARRTANDAQTRARMEQTFAKAGDGEVPIVVIVQCEGYTAVGLRRTRGAFIAVS